MHKVAVASCDNYDKENVDNALSALMSMLDYDFPDFIKSGMTVFIKPNWVASRWRESSPHTDTLWSVITHTAVIEAVCDRAAAALTGQGRIIIGDNPSIDADFEELMRFTDIRRLLNKYDVPVEILDLRPLVCKDLKDYGKRAKMHPQHGDPRGTVEVNLGSQSMLRGMDPALFRGVFDEREDTVASHTGDTQFYTFSKSIYDADVYISVPKLKTHHKVGVTLNLKGLVGSITEKNQLVHWRVGSPETGGDEYPNAASMEAAKSAKVTERGAHPDNDTIWRMVADLYTAFRKGNRKYFSLVDGIIAGEGKGPFCPHAKYANTLIAGDDLLAVDIVSTRLMGLDPNKIRYLKHFLESGEIDCDDIDVLGDAHKSLDFAVPEQWSGIKIKG